MRVAQPAIVARRPLRYPPPLNPPCRVTLDSPFSVALGSGEPYRRGVAVDVETLATTSMSPTDKASPSVRTVRLPNNLLGDMSETLLRVSCLTLVILLGNSPVAKSATAKDKGMRYSEGYQCPAQQRQLNRQRQLASAAHPDHAEETPTSLEVTTPRPSPFGKLQRDIYYADRHARGGQDPYPHPEGPSPVLQAWRKSP